MRIQFFHWHLLEKLPKKRWGRGEVFSIPIVKLDHQTCLQCTIMREHAFFIEAKKMSFVMI